MMMSIHVVAAASDLLSDMLRPMCTQVCIAVPNHSTAALGVKTNMYVKAVRGRDH